MSPKVGIRELLKATLTERMRAGDRDTMSAVRAALAAIDNAEAVPAPSPAPADSGEIAGAAIGVGATELPRRELDEQQMRRLVTVEADERAELSRRLGEHGDSGAARRMFEQATALRFLLDRAERG